jgi:hypothetical protein
MITIPPPISKDEAYKRGYDCGKHGPNKTNCHFRIFATKENTREWERGHAAGKKGAPEHG